MKRIRQYILSPALCAIAALCLITVTSRAQNTVSAPVYIAPGGVVSEWGDLTVTPSGSVTNDGNHYVNFHFTNNGTYGFTLSGTTGTTHFAGGSGATQTISGSGTTLFRYVVFDNARDFNLHQNVSVGVLATFALGVVNEGTTDATRGIVIFNNTARHAGAKDVSHVNGRTRKIGNEPFEFPVGNGTYFRPASLATAPSAQTDAFTARYFSVNPQTALGAEKAVDLAAVNNKEYWIIDRSAGASSPDITLTWDVNKTSGNLPSGLSRMVNARWNSAASLGLWINEGQKSTTGDIASAGSVTSGAAGYGAFTFASGVNLWIGGTAGSLNLWNTASNWKYNEVPMPGEDIVFATANNNNLPAKEDLHVPAADDKTIGDLINASDKNLVVTPTSRITIGGSVQNSSTGTIVVQADKAAATGTLLFANPAANAGVPVTVQFYNKGYDCETCGFYTRKWQYFGIPVTSSAFPATGVETVNQWSEPANGNKWIAATGNLTAFTGYEITNSSKTDPANIYSFTGAINLTDATVSLTKTAGVNYEGMNLVSNSYIAAIPIKEEALRFTAPLANKTVYLFNAGTRDQWRKLNGSMAPHDTRSGQYKAVPIHLAGVAGLPGIIPSMHAFMLQADAPNTLTIKYDQLVKNATVDGVAWRSGRDVARNVSTYIVMDVIGSRFADRVWLFENPSTTRGFDNGWDGHKMPEKDVAQLYVSGEGGDKYQVATVPQLEGTELGFVADANENYTVNLSVTPDVESRRLYLRDLRTRQFIPIRNGSEVIVRGQQGDTGSRFRVVSETAVADKLSSVEIFAKDRVITIVNHSDEHCAAYVYDVAGRLAAQRPVKAKATEQIAMPLQGVYVVKVIGQTVNEAKRVAN